MTVDAFDERLIVSSELWITFFKKLGPAKENLGAEDMGRFVQWRKELSQLEASNENE